MSLTSFSAKCERLPEGLLVRITVRASVGLTVVGRSASCCEVLLYLDSERVNFKLVDLIY